MTTQEILKQALSARIEEIQGYQINIDNYTVAIDIINAGEDSDLAEFGVKLGQLLSSERVEQKKAMVMRDAIRKQLGL
jgi:hypothetical protein